MTPETKAALEKIESLREERDYYKLQSDVLQERLEDTEAALRKAVGQLSLIRADRRVELA
jgi:hypothetical protein